MAFGLSVVCGTSTAQMGMASRSTSNSADFVIFFMVFILSGGQRSLTSWQRGDRF
ncbi:hypothetical protein [Nostoc piscinale]|uniref:hypothetical protein n=1 Tax=Nostoc piscinale TaxID=224012 RepID=UPI00130E8550|nr:hypothetical protein [Nostoc piscinale]